MALLDFFKVSHYSFRTVDPTYLSLLQGLMTLYMSFLLPPFVEALNTYSKSPTNENLWLAIIQTITKSLVHDEGGKLDPITLITLPSNQMGFSVLA